MVGDERCEVPEMKVRNEMMGDKVGKVGEGTSGEMGDDRLRRARLARYEMGVPRETRVEA